MLPDIIVLSPRATMANNSPLEKSKVDVRETLQKLEREYENAMKEREELLKKQQDQLCEGMFKSPLVADLQMQKIKLENYQYTEAVLKAKGALFTRNDQSLEMALAELETEKVKFSVLKTTLKRLQQHHQHMLTKKEHLQNQLSDKKEKRLKISRAVEQTISEIKNKIKPQMETMKRQLDGVEDAMNEMREKAVMIKEQYKKAFYNYQTVQHLQAEVLRKTKIIKDLEEQKRQQEKFTNTITAKKSKYGQQLKKTLSNVKDSSPIFENEMWMDIDGLLKVQSSLLDRVKSMIQEITENGDDSLASNVADPECVCVGEVGGWSGVPLVAVTIDITTSSPSHVGELDEEISPLVELDDELTTDND